MRSKKVTKPLHLQKQKKSSHASAPNDFAFGERSSSNLWYEEDEDSSFDDNWCILKKNLIKFHDGEKELTLTSLVDLWKKDSNLNANVLQLSSLHAKVFALAAKAMDAAQDYHAAKVCILAVGLLLQCRVKSFESIAEFVKKHKEHDSEYEEHMPLLSLVLVATDSPQTMATFLEISDINQLQKTVAKAEPCITVSFNDGSTTERREVCVNSLINLNDLLSTHAGYTISDVRIKHNGSRIFLSNATKKKSLADLGFADGDMIEVNDITRVSCIEDITNLSLNVNPREATLSLSSSKRPNQKKNKKKGKDKR